MIVDPTGDPPDVDQSHDGVPVLEVRGLTVRYGDIVVLDDVTLDVGAGQVVVVLGGSGSGKSTLLRALLGLVPAPGRVHAGRMELHPVAPSRQQAERSVGIDLADGHSWSHVRGRGVGMVFQDPVLALTPLRRVGSLVAEAAPDRSTVERLLARGGFDDPADIARRWTHELSGGMAQRVGMVLAVASAPHLLLADEPTTGLDGPTREEVCRRLREQTLDGVGVILVTHDVSVAAAMADQVVVLDAGRVVEAGPPSEVLRVPRSAAARTLVTNVPWARADRRRPPAASTGQVALRARGLTAAFPGAGKVLDGLELEVGDGQVVGVVGRSGEGKTTLLRCLLGLERAEGGQIEVCGIDPHVQGWTAVRRLVQLVPQDPRGSLNPWRTAEQLVADPLDFHRIGNRRSRRRRAMELLEQVGLGELRARRPNELSTGQCQRVAIARALAVRPRLLVADEPASALDVTLQAEVVALLEALVADQGMSGLVVSHDLYVLERLCDRIAVLDRGRIVEDLPTSRLRTDAMHPRTLALLAASPVDPLAKVPG